MPQQGRYQNQTNPDYEGDGGVSATMQRPDGGGDEEFGPERLFAILEETVPRPDEALALTQEQLQLRKEMVEQTWDRVRRWFWAHNTQEDRAAAAHIRGNADATPLHLMCKLNNPPTDVIHNVVEAAPEVVTYVDSHGWLPLHHACANGASPEVLELLITAYPESKLCQDNQNRTPLHFYATRNSDNPASMAANVALLCDTGAAELPDRGGMLPMHYACAYGTSPTVLKVLAEAYPESLATKENKGRTPIHLAMVNAHRDASPGVIRFLLEGDGTKTVNMRDDEGNLPLHLLSLGLRGLNFEEPEKLNNVMECLKMYLAAEPFASPDFLTALQELPDWLQDVAVVSPHVRNILNEKIVQRFPTSILMLDGIVLMILIICFEITTTAYIDYLYDETKETGSGKTLAELNKRVCLFLLFGGGSYFLLRELIQIMSLLSLGSFTSWFFDTTNWVDLAVITSVYYYACIMILEDENFKLDRFRPGAAFTKGILWMAVIYFLKSTLVDFAVFVGGVYYVVQRLVAFLLAVGVILLAFAQMFFIVYKETEVCKQSPEDPEEFLLEFGFPPCKFPHCTFEESLLKVYTMMMGEIGTETRYNSGEVDRKDRGAIESSVVAQILYVGYAFLVVILLSNVLIAIVTDSYEIIQNDRAAIVFWSNRLDFVAEMDAMASVVRQRLCPVCFGGDGKNSRAPGAPLAVQEGPNGTTTIQTNDDMATSGSKGYMREGWKQVMALFESNVYDEVDLNLSNLEFWVYLGYQGFAGIIVIPTWLFLGFATAGWLWPPQVREYLFVQKETAVSRAELERQKLEQLRDIQVDIRTLKTEIRKEMATDRDDMIRMKAEVEAVQSEVLSDLQQVKELMTTLLDLGGISQDR